MCSEDFTRFAEWGTFLAGSTCPFGNRAQLDNWGRANVNVDGDGLRYRYRAQPTRCGDQIVGQATIPLPAGTREVWIEWDARFSSNFDTGNPNCGSSPAPDFKYVLVWLRGDAGCGIDRAELKMGQNGNQIAAAVPGFPQCDDAKVNGTVRVPGARAFFDGRTHHYRLAFRMLGASMYEVYLSIDQTVTHSYVTRSVSDAGLSFESVMLGSNRNLGATSDMFLHWRNMKVWAR